MNIRIGNDIVLDIRLNESKMQNKSLNRAQVYLVNIKNKPLCGCDDSSASCTKNCIHSEYTIHGCGVPQYNVQVGQIPQDRGLSCFEGTTGKKHPSYKACTTIVDDTHITATFPAVHQKHLGSYQVIVEAVVEDSNGIHSYAFDFGSAFSLTDKPFGQDGEIVIQVPNLDASVVGICEINKVVCIDQDTSLAIGGKDHYDNEYGFITHLHADQSVKYNPNRWIYSPIHFKSSDPITVSVSDAGELTACATEVSRDVVVTAYNSDNILISAPIIVHVIGSKTDASVQLYSTLIYDPLIKQNQSEINCKLNASIAAIENTVGKTIDDMFVVVTTQNQYDRLESLNQLKDNTFYYTYDGDDDSDARVVDNTLYCNATIANNIAIMNGRVENYTLIL